MSRDKLKTECDFHQLQERVMNINFVAIFLPWNSNYHVFLKLITS